MAYLQPSDADPIPADLIVALGKVLDLAIPEGDLDALSTALRDQLASIESIGTLRGADTGAVMMFDPRWHD